MFRPSSASVCPGESGESGKSVEEARQEATLGPPLPASSERIHAFGVSSHRAPFSPTHRLSLQFPFTLSPASILFSLASLLVAAPCSEALLSAACASGSTACVPDLSACIHSLLSVSTSCVPDFSARMMAEASAVEMCCVRVDPRRGSDKSPRTDAVPTLTVYSRERRK